MPVKCHVHVQPVIAFRKGFDKLEAASDMEEDLLDKAWGLEQTSRLSCQTIPLKMKKLRLSFQNII